MLIVESDLSLYGVLDGMGGAAAGDLASQVAAEAIVCFMKEHVALKTLPSRELLELAIEAAATRVYSESQKDAVLNGMGTTVVACIVESDRIIVGHVGDSRAYLWRRGELRQLTRDHTLVQEWVESGALTVAEAAASRHKHVLTRNLGSGATVTIAFAEHALEPGDRLLLCSDGLHDVASESEMSLVLGSSAFEYAADHLIELALPEGTDNISAVVIEVEPVRSSRTTAGACTCEREPVARVAELRSGYAGLCGSPPSEDGRTQRTAERRRALGRPRQLPAGIGDQIVVAALTLSIAACTSEPTLPPCTPLPDGACAAVGEFAYVNPDGVDNPTCSQTEPCARLHAALATGRPYVMVHGRVDDSVTIGSGRVVTIVGDPLPPGLGYRPPLATLTSSGSTGVLMIRDDARVSLYNLELSGVSSLVAALTVALGSTAHLTVHSSLIINNWHGISVQAGTLELVNSQIVGNRSGGVEISGNASFTIVNDVFAQNGSDKSLVGGLSVSTVANRQNRIDFDTFYNNVASPEVASALDCKAGAFTVHNLILWSDVPTAKVVSDAAGSCMISHAIANRPIPGIGNMVGDPKFIDAAHRDFRIRRDSPVAGRGSPDVRLDGPAARDAAGRLRPR